MDKMDEMFGWWEGDCEDRIYKKKERATREKKQKTG